MKIVNTHQFNFKNSLPVWIGARDGDESLIEFYSGLRISFHLRWDSSARVSITAYIHSPGHWRSGSAECRMLSWWSWGNVMMLMWCFCIAVASQVAGIANVVEVEVRRPEWGVRPVCTWPLPRSHPHNVHTWGADNTWIIITEIKRDRIFLNYGLPGC